ncbi:hypothetical protein FHX46_004736 [Amycolatopsis viridis]|uniref:Uncharacterized protein n=1 Tax=Amycolatopsis viridis TaxID=185678 RepID=A0ABX0T3R9_9PSEU|nr:hypothetical protein [Amycolatopsis viridis]
MRSPAWYDLSVVAATTPPVQPDIAVVVSA